VEGVRRERLAVLRIVVVGVLLVTPPFQLCTTGFRFPDIRGHSAPQADFGLARNFPIRERMNVELRAQAFTLTNTPIFGNPDTSNIRPLRTGHVNADQLAAKLGVGTARFVLNHGAY